MSASSESAGSFVRSLMALAERMAARDLAVSSLRCEWGHMGSWILEVQDGKAADAYGQALLKQNFDVPGPNVTRFTWDGREQNLTIQTAPTEPLSSPGPWKVAKTSGFPSSEAAVQFVERYLDGSA